MGNLIQFPKRHARRNAATTGGSSMQSAASSAGAWRSWWESAKRALHLKSSSMWIKSAQALLLAVAVCFSVGASSDTGTRMSQLSHRLMCQCGCAQLLGECDHVGCPSRDKELGELSADIAAGLSDKQILDDFVGKYGMIVLAAPPAQGFNLVAWIAPFAVFAAALLGTILLIRRWGGLRGFKAQPADHGADLAALDPAERERREKIRRETEGGGGFDDGGGSQGGSSR